MIKSHEFNTRWWGKPVGIVTEPGFFATPEPEQRRLLERFFRHPGTTEERVNERYALWSKQHAWAGRL